jgi:hypothetical protein
MLDRLIGGTDRYLQILKKTVSISVMPVSFINAEVLFTIEYNMC